MIQNNVGLNKVWKWVIGIFLFLIILFGSAALYLSAKWKPLLSEKIKASVYDGSHHLYKIDFKDIHLNLLTSSATLDSVTLIPDTAVFDALKKIKLAPAYLMQLNLDQLQFSGVGILTTYFKKKLDMKAVILNKPSITLIHHNVEKRPDTIVGQKTLYEQISKTLKSIRVRKINIIAADFTYINGDNGKKQHAIKHLNVSVDDFLLDSLSQTDTSRIYYTKDISFELIDYKSLSKDKMYTFKADTITGSVKGKKLHVNGFYMLPKYADLAFTRKYKTQKDRYDLKFKKMNFSGIDLVKLNQEGSLHAQSLTLGPAKVAVFLSREMPPPPIDKGKNYPHLALQRLPLQLHIDTVKINNIHVAYTEYNPITQKRGTVDLENLNGTILNVTNDSLQLTKNNHAIANLSARIIKAAQINIHLNLNLTSKNGAFSYSGKIGPMNMTALNPVSKSLGLVKIEQGKVQKADFNIKGNLQGSRGTVRFYYTNLKVALLKEGEDGEATKKKGFLSFLANTIVIKHNNPSKGEDVRVAEVNFKRTHAASFFNLLWKSVFMGIRETIGIGVVPIKGPEKAYDKVSEKKQERQEKRQERKEERIKEKKKKADKKTTKA
ncbi:hypothetical protein AAKU52_000556 [Pedobacter sp. CG_S7]|uniref:hypothetical protein n=1 Tax=Pedobacter sp. CG_S7 TaxID=3143930 RepID=UPI0033943361